MLRAEDDRALERFLELHRDRREPSFSRTTRAAFVATRRSVSVKLANCLDLDTERSALYADIVRVALGDAARAALEALMQSPKYEFQSDFARKYTALGRAEGKLEGRLEGEATAILRVLARRGLVVGEEHRSRILACTDLAILETWLDRAIAATSVDEVFP